MLRILTYVIGKSVVVSIPCCLTFTALSQPENLSLNKSVAAFYEVGMYNLESSLHTAIRPILATEYRPDYPGTSLDSACLGKAISGKRFGSESNAFSIYPLMNISGDYETNNFKSGDLTHYLANGFGLSGKLTNRWQLNFNYLYADYGLSPYQQSIAESNNAVPALGGINRADGNYFNHYADGYISYSPSEIFNFQAGMGRNFIGDGYRSILLSDYAYNYPYLKISTKVWKLKYVNLFASQFDANGRSIQGNSFDNKYSSTHYLSMNVGRRLNIGIFESVIWRGKDSTYNRNFDLNYLNPVIFLRPVEFSVGSPDNVLLGLNMSYKLRDGWLLYGQLMLDEFLLSEIRAGEGWWANKYAFQLGFKAIWAKNDLVLELNQARPYTYTHSSVSQNYGHYNLPLAHPLGANFREVLLIGRHREGNMLFEALFNYSATGVGIATENNGQNIFLSNNSREKEYGNNQLQGNVNSRLSARFTSSYFLNWKSGLHLNAGFQFSSASDDSVDLTNFFIGISTGIFNRYTN